MKAQRAAAVVGLVVVVAGLVVLLGRPAGATWPPAGDDQAAFLPVVWREAELCQATATLGPSPTPTRTPTSGPTDTPGPTPTASFRVEQGIMPERGIVGTEFRVTLGLLNSLEVAVQVTLVNTLPDGMIVDGIWPPTGTGLLVADNGTVFTATLTVPRQWSDNLFFAAHVITPPCMPSCYVQNTAAWTARWPGGGNSGVSHSNRLLLVNVTPSPTPVTPSPTPTATWTPMVYPTPSVGPSPTPTAPPTLGPSPTPTPGR